MQNATTGTFNKEKLTFLVSSAVVSSGLYLFLTSGPIPLEPVPPMAYGQNKPAALNVKNMAERQQEDYYVVDGKISHIIDKRTNQLVNREREFPFEPYKTFAVVANKPPNPKNPQNTPPPPPADMPPPKKPDDVKKWDAETAEAEVEFMGVMTMADGETYGLLKPKDGSPVIRVKQGSEIEAGGQKYTVTEIEKQSILVADAENRPYLLQDTSFDPADSSSSDSKSSNSKDAAKNTSKDTSKNSSNVANNKPMGASGTNTGQQPKGPRHTRPPSKSLKQ